MGRDTSKQDYEALLRHVPRSQGGTGPELGTGFHARGGGVKMTGCVANSVAVAFDVVGTNALTLEQCESIGSTVALVGDETKYLSVFDFKIDGKTLANFIGDFSDLTVWTADDVYSIGAQLTNTDPFLRVSVLKHSAIGKWLRKRDFKDWMALANFLVALFALKIAMGK